MAKSKRTQVMGFILDSAQLQAVELSGTSDMPVVSAFGTIPLAAGLVTDGIVQDVPAVAGKVSQLMRENGFTAKQVMLGVKNSNVLLRMASFPKVPDDKLRGAVLYQAQQFIPIPVAELVLDFVVCSENNTEERPQLNVLLVGAKKIYVRGLVNVMEKVGLRVQDIDAALLATCRGVSAARPPHVTTYLMVTVDSEMVSIAVLRGEEVMMTRSVVLSAELSTILAESTGGKLNMQACKDAALALQGDIAATSSYFASQKALTMDMTYLVGQFPSLDGIAKELTALTGLPVETPRLYRNLTGIDTTTYGACISLALRGLEE